ncbi:MAG: glucose-6-phosphate dehydrogenase, partial [Clostridia bacterium]|nr:glucose-6-phosphate dehydrogenase [Clostridia bacterium]
MSIRNRKVDTVQVDNTQPCVMVIFGGTGDLTHTKLMPALYRLKMDALLPKMFHVIAVGRRDLTNDDYVQGIYNSVQESNELPIDEVTWSEFSKCIYYHRQTFDDDSGYAVLKEKLAALSSDCNVLYYLAVSPEY